MDFTGACYSALSCHHLSLLVRPTPDDMSAAARQQEADDEMAESAIKVREHLHL